MLRLESRLEPPTLKEEVIKGKSCDCCDSAMWKRTEMIASSSIRVFVHRCLHVLNSEVSFSSLPYACGLLGLLCIYSARPGAPETAFVLPESVSSRH